MPFLRVFVLLVLRPVCCPLNLSFQFFECATLSIPPLFAYHKLIPFSFLFHQP